jgi:hypothetical protein
MGRIFDCKHRDPACSLLLTLKAGAQAVLLGPALLPTAGHKVLALLKPAALLCARTPKQAGSSSADTSDSVCWCSGWDGVSSAGSDPSESEADSIKFVSPGS